MELSAREQGILTLLSEKGEMSRSDLARLFGLTKAAVTVITNDMIKSGVLLETGELYDETAPSRGRRKRLIDINSDYRLAFGIALTEEKIDIGLCNLRGAVLDKRQYPYEPCEYRDLLQQIVGMLEEIMKNNCISYENLISVGVCSNFDFLGRGGKENPPQALMSIKKDLSHGVPIKVHSCEFIEGAARAQRSFSLSEQGLIVSLNNKIQAAFYMGKNIYRGENGQLLGMEQGVDLAEHLITAANFFDISRVFVFGDEERERALADEIFAKNESILVERAVCGGARGFLAGASVAVEREFYKFN